MLLSTFALFFFVINLVSLKSLLESQHPSTPENKVALGASLQPVSAVVCNLGSYRYAVSGVRQLLYLERLRIVRFVRHKATDKDVTMKMQMKNQHSMHVKICLQQNVSTIWTPVTWVWRFVV